MPIIGAYVIFSTSVTMEPLSLLGFMYDLQTFFKNVKNVKTLASKEGKVSLQAKVKTFHGFDRELVFDLNVESVTQNSIIIKGSGELADFVLKAEVKPADKGSMADIRINCESKEGGVCNNFVSLLYSGLLELFERPPKVSVKPPPITVPPTPPTPTPAPVKPEAPVPTPAPAAPAPKREEEEYPVEKLLDETYLAVLMLKSDLITTKNLSPGWTINDLVKTTLESIREIAKYKLALITIRDPLNRMSVTIPVSRAGDFMGFVGVVDNKPLKGYTSDLEKTMPIMTRMPVTIRLWGVKELV
ncbi:hypothetical protein IMZ38_03490 [Thermosphaera chiliense]|uniref:Uncharacterized protein n=1 Tax=Thermosphaera chiliense TaxID=3402707 RepID=A0A7M1URS1_9CREN|nr:hypothetical protein [Thermosphaera aggregans]QOR94975.1 hypothetical protein IMZ38_03490 [Thermosphaera aggregans]